MPTLRLFSTRPQRLQKSNLNLQHLWEEQEKEIPISLPLVQHISNCSDAASKEALTLGFLEHHLVNLGHGFAVGLFFGVFFSFCLVCQ